MSQTYYAIFLIVFTIGANKAHTETNIFELMLLHNNDMRSCLEESLESNTKVGGYARISNIVKEARKAAFYKQGPAVLYLNAGDVYTDEIWRNPYSRQVLIEIFNQIKPDAAGIGIHDLNAIENLVHFLRKIKFPIVASNLHYKNKTRRLRHFIKPSVILLVHNKLVGIVGYFTPKVHFLRSKSGFYIEDEISAVKRESSLLKNKSVDIIIALGYSGYSIDKSIAEEVDTVDIIVGGFSNTLLWNGKQPGSEIIQGPYPVVLYNKINHKEVLLLHAYGFTKYMGRIILRFDENNTLINYESRPLYLDSSIRQDEELLSIINTYRKALKETEDEEEVLVQSIVTLDAHEVRYDESNLANLITDAFVLHMAKRYENSHKREGWSDTAIAVINAGAIRRSVLTSRTHPNVTRRILKEVIPYSQRLIKITMLGQYLQESLEVGVRSNGETARGEFLQFSGLRVIYDFSQRPGERVLQVRVKCAACEQPSYSRIDPTSEYKIVTTAFLANGGDGHVIFRSKGFDIHEDDVYDIDACIDVFKTFGKLRPEYDERIQKATTLQRRYFANDISRRVPNLYCNISVFFYTIFLIYYYM